MFISAWEGLGCANACLGVSCQAWLYGELFLHCYVDQSPAEDILQVVCRSAYLVRFLAALGQPS